MGHLSRCPHHVSPVILISTSMPSLLESWRKGLAISTDESKTSQPLGSSLDFRPKGLRSKHTYKSTDSGHKRRAKKG
jgi:hypothetical protein